MIHRSIGAVSHGILDYALAILLLAARRSSASPACRRRGRTSSAACCLAMAILTRYPLGIIKIVGLGIHGFVELLLAHLSHRRAVVRQLLARRALAAIST